MKAKTKDRHDAVKVVRRRCYQYYDVVTEKRNIGDVSPAVMMRSAYSKSGDYIGNSRWAYKLVHVYGIRKFEKATDAHKLCSIGFSPEDKKWYGWSHRAIYGFGIGSSHKGKYARNLKEAKRLAIRFAASVS